MTATTVAMILFSVIMLLTGIVIGSASGHEIGFKEGFDVGVHSATDAMNQLMETLGIEVEEDASAGK